MKKIILPLIAMLISPMAIAEAEPEDQIKYRKAVMTAVKGHNNAIKMIVTGKIEHAGQLNAHINSMEALFGELDYLFPEGSDLGKTDAKEEIWDQPDKFARTVKDSKQALADFKSVAAGGNMSATAGAFKKFGKASCGGCHKSFKKKSKK